LKEHEQIRPEYLEKLKEEIKADGILKLSIAVDKNTNVIIDGHHRLHALKKLGAEKIPVTYFDYQTPEIKVLSWKKNETVTKEQIIQAGMTGKRFPPKFSKHMIENNGKLFHISSFEKKVDIPLDELKRH
jgi:hypothetical protein